MEEEEDIAGINSEMRFITLELMKIAAQKKRSFKSVAGEFVDNVYGLGRAIRERSASARVHKRRARANVINNRKK